MLKYRIVEISQSQRTNKKEKCTQQHHKKKKKKGGLEGGIEGVWCLQKKRIYEIIKL